MLRTEFRQKKLQLPEMVDELDPDQYCRFIFLVTALKSSLITPGQFKQRWTSYLLGLKNYDYSLLLPEHISRAKEIEARILPGFIEEARTGNGAVVIQPKFDSFRNLLPEYGSFKGPGDWLHGLSFGDFVKCLTILDQDCGAEAMAEVARTMYHIPDDGTKVPDILLFHAPLFFTTVWTAILSGPVNINGREINLSIIFRNSSGKRKADDKTGWAGVTFEVAQAGLFGTVREVEQADMWEVLLYLYKCKFEYDNQKK